MSTHDTQLPQPDFLDENTTPPLAESTGAIFDDPDTPLDIQPYPEGEQDPEASVPEPSSEDHRTGHPEAPTGGPEDAPLPGASRNGIEALAWAARQVDHSDPPSGYTDWHNICLVFVRSCFGIDPRYRSAEVAYYESTIRRGTRSTPPAGVPVWWTNGGYGHVALSAGDGYCYSTDFLRHGLVDKVSISAITRGWGQTYRGWTEDLNGVDVWRGGQPQRRAVSLSDIRAAAQDDRSTPPHGAWRRDVRLVERALSREGLLDPALARDGYAGPTFRDSYARWQKRVVGPPYDGIPGERSLTELGRLHGFGVID